MLEELLYNILIIYILLLILIDYNNIAGLLLYSGGPSLLPRSISRRVNAPFVSAEVFRKIAERLV